jgi:hypothetical protein|tara:strand:+ start:19 stop:222 length:204 start_codon:yes stop_codon:yes gene_type:complete
MKKDDISNPVHYTQGKIEVWDFISDQKFNFLEGNIVKYVSRWRIKGKIADLKKAQAYLNKLIEVEDK